MQVKVITPPAPIVSLADAKAYLQVSGSDRDVALQLCIDAAQSEIDGPDGWLNRAIGLQTLELSAPPLDRCGWISLPYPEIGSVVSVTSANVALDGSTYELGGDGVLRPVSGSAWPWPWGRTDGVKVRYTAGYAQVPAAIKMALLSMVQEQFSRGGRDPSLIVDTIYGVGSQQFAAASAGPMRDAVRQALMSYRVWSL